MPLRRFLAHALITIYFASNALLFSFVLMMTAGLAIPEKVAGTDKELADRAAANTIYEGMKYHLFCF